MQVSAKRPPLKLYEKINSKSGNGDEKAPTVGGRGFINMLQPIYYGALERVTVYFLPLASIHSTLFELS